jgi:hypothetical protein
MKEAIKDLPCANNLEVRFYDRNQIAEWVNLYKGVVLWVREKVGQPLSGWTRICGVAGEDEHNIKPYLFNDHACLIDDTKSSKKHENPAISLLEGIERMRAILRGPKQCVRLVGLSGLGKTRLVHALFEVGVGKSPLDASIAVYTDYSTSLQPTAETMARKLVTEGRRVVLVVDNCNPETHSTLVKICTDARSQVSLITVEYDIRDDETEDTKVFRLKSSSPELLISWLRENFPNITDIVCRRIAEFSDGNFRIAKAIAKSVGKHDTLGQLNDSGLIKKIIQQRHEHDPELYKAAEVLSLLYSIDVSDISANGELAQIGSLQHINPVTLYDSLAKLADRDVVQVRGRFRAILPQAIANRLATDVLRRIHPNTFDQFCSQLSPRMRKSLSRRLGYLHDSEEAKSIVIRLLRPDGPMGDLFFLGEEGFQIICSIAPVAPEATLEKLESELSRSRAIEALDSFSRQRHHIIQLIKSLAYDAALFERAITLLSRFVVIQNHYNNQINDPGYRVFSECFHLYFSGTLATPEQRRNLITEFNNSRDPHLQQCSQFAIRELFYYPETYIPSSSFEFGAHSRDWGWWPKNYDEVGDWFAKAIALVLELIPENDARSFLGTHFHPYWLLPKCFEEFEQAASHFEKSKPWVEGWIATRETLRHNGDNLKIEERSKLIKFIEMLRPKDLLNQARAVIFRENYLGDCDLFCDENDTLEEGSSEKADLSATIIAKKLSEDDTVRSQFLAEAIVYPQNQNRITNLGIGLAEYADSLDSVWLELKSIYLRADPEKRSETLLGSFIQGAYQRDKVFTSNALDSLLSDPHFLNKLPLLQSYANLDAEGVDRIINAIEIGNPSSLYLNSLYYENLWECPSDKLSIFLQKIVHLPNYFIAIDILFTLLRKKNELFLSKHSKTVTIGRDILQVVISESEYEWGDYAEYMISELIPICFSGNDAKESADSIFLRLREKERIIKFINGKILSKLFQNQPLSALNNLLLPSLARGLDVDSCWDSPFEKINPEILKEWASIDPINRYRLLSETLSMFSSRLADEAESISTLFLIMLNKSPDKMSFLGDAHERLFPKCWSGSLVTILNQRKLILVKLAEDSEDPIRNWINNCLPDLDECIREAQIRESQLESEREESFE